VEKNLPLSSFPDKNLNHQPPPVGGKGHIQPLFPQKSYSMNPEPKLSNFLQFLPNLAVDENLRNHRQMRSDQPLTPPDMAVKPDLFPFLHTIHRAY